MNRVFVFGSLMIFLGSATPGASQVPAEWDRAYARFSEGYRKLDAGMVSSLYAEDAFYLQPASEVKRGRNEIHKSFDSFFKNVAQHGDSVRIAFDFIDRSVSGDLGYDIGHYTLTGYAAGKPPSTSRGKFVVIWKRKDGVWRIHSDGYSGVDQPPPPAK